MGLRFRRFPRKRRPYAPSNVGPKASQRMKISRRTILITGLLFLLLAAFLLFQSPARHDVLSRSDDAVLLLTYGRELIDTVRASLETLPSQDRGVVEAGLDRLESAWKELRQIQGRNGDTTAATDRFLSLLQEMTSGDIPVRKGLENTDETGN